MEIINFNRVDDQSQVLNYKKNHIESQKSIAIAWKKTDIFSKALHNFIAAHWTEIKSQETVKLNLFIPSKQTSYGMRLRMLRVDKRGETVVHVVVAEVDSWLIRQVLGPPPEFYFEEIDQLPRLVYYHGPTTLSTEKGTDFPVDIDFSYDTISE